jgi:hypothetical protein
MSGRNKGIMGLVLLFIFTAILVMMFLPLVGGQNALEYLDELYNSISKGSAYYIPAMREEIIPFSGNEVAVTLQLHSEKEAEQTGSLYKESGVDATVSGAELIVRGDLGRMLENCLDDAEAMYNNNAEEITKKYGYDEKQALYNWWYSLKALDKDLNRQKLFKEAKVVALVKKKAVETSYNYYGVEPQKITDRIGVVIFSLVFYVIYTLWYGYAIMYIFEGLGLRFGH